ncbi:MAG: hypothetical protein KAQ92_09215, partial [Candidatus Aenigmarchaeota archaeon]|nr:hypothetical protein [Candidatus Aenigmarchaeota archaeon]
QENLSEGNSQEWMIYCINLQNATGNNTKIFNIDLTNPLINYTLGTRDNNSHFDRNYIYINISAYDLNEANVTFRLYNSTNSLNTTTLAIGTRSINFTDIDEGIYYYNASIEDKVNHKNTTETRTIIIDTIVPLWSENKTKYNSGLEYSADRNYQFNITWNDTYMDEVLIEHDFTGTLTNYSANNISNEYYYNIVGMPSGNHTYRWYAKDRAGNSNRTNSRIYEITSDTTQPNITLISPSNTSTWTSSSTVTFTYDVTDNSNITNCSLLINGAIDQTDTTITTNISQTFTKTLVNANYNWAVSCYDYDNNSGNSTTYQLTVSHTAPPADDPPAEGGSSSGGGGGGGGVLPVPKECTINSNCSLSKYCLKNKCVAIECECGYIKNHECIEYECCSDADCNYKCENHKCVENITVVENITNDTGGPIVHDPVLRYEILKLIRETQRNIDIAKEKKNTTLAQQKLDEAVLLYEADKYNEAKRVVFDAIKLLENAPLLDIPKKKSYLWIIGFIAILLFAGWFAYTKRNFLFAAVKERKKQKPMPMYQNTDYNKREVNNIIDNTIQIKSMSDNYKNQIDELNKQIEEIVEVLFELKKKGQFSVKMKNSFENLMDEIELVKALADGNSEDTIVQIEKVKKLIKNILELRAG